MKILLIIWLCFSFSYGLSGCDLKNDAPDLRINVSPTKVSFNTEVVMDASSSSDEDGDIDEKTFEWSQSEKDELKVSLAFSKNKSIAKFTTPDAFIGKIDLHFTLKAKDKEGKASSKTIVVRLDGTEAYVVQGKVVVDSSTHVDSDINNPRANYVSNDTFAKAQSVNTPSRVVGYVNNKGEGPQGRSTENGDRRDFFKMTMLKKQTIELTYYVGSEKKLDDVIYYENDFDLYLYDKDENLIDIVVYGEITEVELSLDKRKVKRETLSLAVPEKGVYFIQVYAGRGSGSYKLEVTDKIHVPKAGELSLSADFVVGEAIVKYASGTDLQRQKRLNTDNSTSQIYLGNLNKISAGMAQDKSNNTIALFQFDKLKQAHFKGVNSSVGQQQRIDTLKKIALLRQQKGVIYAEPNYIVKPLKTKPNDPLFSKQWHYETINLPRAWDISTGSINVVVAVIDTGIHADHPDFSGQTIRNGYDFIKDRNNAGDDFPGGIYPPGYSSIDPDPTDAIKRFSHGTHVSGTVMAASDNEIGTSGIAWKTSLMPVRVLGKFGGTTYDLAQGIYYASGLKNDSRIVLDETRRADIINMSLGGLGFSQFEQDAISQGRKNNVIFIAASGNSSSEVVTYPGAYKGVIAVGAVDKNKKLTDYSNYGEAQDIVAPGGNTSQTKEDGVLSLYADGDTYDYKFAQGTSMASPHIAGVVALMKATYSELNPETLDLWLEGEILSNDLGDYGFDQKYGVGLIDAHKALKVAQKAARGEKIYIPPRVKVSPLNLNFSYDFNRLPFVIRAIVNPDGEKLKILKVSADKSWVNIDKSQVLYGYGIYEAVIDRSKLKKSLFSATITVELEDAEKKQQQIKIKVFINNTTKTVSLLGVLDVVLYDAYELKRPNPAVYFTEAKALSNQKGAYQYTFKNIEEGKYYIESVVDLDNDHLFSRQRFDLIGAPNDLPFTILDVVKDIDNMDFSTSIRSGF